MVVEVSVEMILMQPLLLLLLLLLFWSLVGGGIIGEGITFCIFTINTNHGNTTQAIRRAILFWHKFLIAALNLHSTIHFHCFDILHLKQINFLRILIIFKMKNRFWIWTQHSLTLAVFFTTALTSHGTFPLMNFLWIKLSFRTCKFLGYFLLNTKPQSDSQKCAKY